MSSSPSRRFAPCPSDGLPRARRLADGCRFRPAVELLEHRCLMTVLTDFTDAVGDPLSLRGLIAGGTTQISFPSGSHTILLTQGPIAISTNVTIQGVLLPGSTGPLSGYLQDLVDGGKNGRIFDITGGATVVFKDLEISNGYTQNGNGGGINVTNSGQLTLQNSLITGNQAGGFGGGIFNSAGSTLILDNSQVYSNVSDTAGGGIANSGTMTLKNGSEVSGNRSYGTYSGGGGIWTGTQSSTTILTGVGISNNSTQSYGGAIDNRGALTIDGTGGTHPYLLFNTVRDGNGGGIYNHDTGTATITNTTISRNIADGLSGFGYGGGISTAKNSLTTIVSSTITNNVANGGDGGGIDCSGTLNLTSSTVSGNTATTANSTHFGLDGGVHIDKGGTWATNTGNTFANNTPTSGAQIAVATDDPEAKLLDASSQTLQLDVHPFPNSFTGGVRVAKGDVNGDGASDLIVGAGPGGGPQVMVYDGKTGQLIRSFYGLSPTFTGGIYVAAGDLNGDGSADIIVAADKGGGPQVTIYNGKDGSILASFFAFNSKFTGGVRVAVGDVNGDGTLDIICAAGPGGGPQITVFDGLSLMQGKVVPILNFYAFNPSFRGGVYVAAGDFNHDGKMDIVAGAGAGGGPQVSMFSGADGSLLHTLYAFAPNFTGGVRVGTADVNGDGFDDLILGAGPGGGPQVRSVDSQKFTDLDNFFAFDSTFTGGISLG